MKVIKAKILIEIETAEELAELIQRKCVSINGEKYHLQREAAVISRGDYIISLGEGNFAICEGGITVHALLAKLLKKFGIEWESLV